VLGDELCAGTESTSAEALVAAGIRWLANRSTKFIFATHLHHLPTLLAVTDLRLAIYHIHVSYDPITQKLIYDRELRPGSGTSLYGLEVARAMDLPLAFIDDAIQNRHKILGSVRQEDASISVYNTSIARRKCEICNETRESEIEVHHIEPQCLAINGILPNGKLLNSAANLISVCASCHDKHHAGQLQIQPLVVTSDGLERTSTGTSERTVNRGNKWTDEEKDTISSVLNKYNQLSLKAIQGYLKNNCNIAISITTLGNLRKELN
jgi:DNA mismatch repair protein MutS